jgi:UDP-N-acetylglucosamine:LPS N-acetylglucosamine transferase
VDLVWFNAGGGHRAAALALEQVMQAQGRPWTVRRVNLTEVLDPTALFKRVLGFEPEDIYNKRLASGFTLGLGQELKLLQAGIRLAHTALVQRLAAHWQATEPDLVVSLIPNFNRALHDSLALARPGTPFVTVMTDMADHPPSFWIEPGTAQQLVCGTEHAVQQAFAAGVPAERVHRARGMVLRPDFHAPPQADRVLERAMVGLDAHTPTGLVLFGGTGSRVMKRIAAKLPDTPLVLMCGKNDKLAAELRALPARAPRIVVGFSSEVARWMRRCDFFIGKPGPGSLSEAVSQGLPVITTRNAWTMPQERFNTDWVQAHGLGLVMRRFAEVDEAVPTLLAELPAYRSRVVAMENRAVFDVPDILAGVLARQHAGRVRAAPSPP